MKLVVETEVLQSLTSRAVKGASCNKMIPLTNLMAIDCKDGKLTLITTDSTNYLYVIASVENDDDFYAVVPVDLFYKLVSRMTCKTITIEYVDGSMRVHGNGDYTIALPLDEEGEAIKFPDPVETRPISDAATETVNLSTIRMILNTAKASLAMSIDVPCYTGYYVGNRVVTTDSIKMCGIDTKMLTVPRLISADMMDLLDVMTHENIKVYYNGENILFSTDDCKVYGKTMDCIDDYQIAVINGLLDDTFDSKCVVYKDALLQLLDRLSLFVGVYDKNSIYLTFKRDSISITSKQTNGAEEIPYISSSNFTNEFVCCIDIEMLRSQIKANTSDRIEIHYGKSNAIKITNNIVTQVIALMEN